MGFSHLQPLPIFNCGSKPGQQLKEELKSRVAGVRFVGNEPQESKNSPVIRDAAVWDKTIRDYSELARTQKGENTALHNRKV